MLEIFFWIIFSFCFFFIFFSFWEIYLKWTKTKLLWHENKLSMENKNNFYALKLIFFFFKYVFLMFLILFLDYRMFASGEGRSIWSPSPSLWNIYLYQPNLKIRTWFSFTCLFFHFDKLSKTKIYAPSRSILKSLPLHVLCLRHFIFFPNCIGNSICFSVVIDARLCNV